MVYNTGVYYMNGLLLSVPIVIAILLGLLGLEEDVIPLTVSLVIKIIILAILGFALSISVLVIICVIADKVIHLQTRAYLYPTSIICSLEGNGLGYQDET